MKLVIHPPVEAERLARIAGAAGPMVVEGMPNVIITPHVAGTSPRIAERHLGVLLDNVGRFARGEPLVNVVDKRRWF